MSASASNAAVIAVDAMGSDKGPAEIVAAVAIALGHLQGGEVIALVGDEAVLRPLLAGVGLGSSERVRVVHASEVVAMDDKPMAAIKRKKDSSMVRAIELVKAGEASAVVSCGNTGALMAGSTIKLRTLDGVDRPALAAVIPHRTGHFLLVDAGANPEAEPQHLVHNALLGASFCRVVLGIEKPRVGLLTIGTEEGKGNKLVTETHELLKRTEGIIDYRGPIEGFQLFENEVDVVVCDGFTGNIVLKSAESLFGLLKDFVKDELKKNPIRMLGAALSMGAFKAIKGQLNPDRYGGAPLLGLRGYVLKAHGSSNRHAVCSAITSSARLIKMQMNERIGAEVALVNDRIRESAPSA